MIPLTEIWIGYIHHIKKFNQVGTLFKMRIFRKYMLSLIIFEQMRMSKDSTTKIYCCGCGCTNRNGPEFGACMYGEAVTTGGPFITGIT